MACIQPVRIALGWARDRCESTMRRSRVPCFFRMAAWHFEMLSRAPFSQTGRAREARRCYIQVHCRFCWPPDTFQNLAFQECVNCSKPLGFSESHTNKQQVHVVLEQIQTELHVNFQFWLWPHNHVFIFQTLKQKAISFDTDCWLAFKRWYFSTIHLYILTDCLMRATANMFLEADVTATLGIWWQILLTPAENGLKIANVTSLCQHFQCSNNGVLQEEKIFRKAF